MKTLISWAAGLSLLVAALVWLAEPVSYAVELPKETADGLVKAEADAILDALENKKPNAKLSAKRAKAAALYMAAIAQDQLGGKGNAQEAATVRDAALQLFDALNDDKFDDAKKLATDIKAGLKVNAAASPKPVPLGGKADLDLVMLHFKAAKGGGQDLETKIKELKGKAIAKDLGDIEKFAAKSVAMMQLTEEMPPADANAAKKKLWAGFAKDAKDASLEASQAAKGGKVDVVKKALAKLDTACVNCHNEFK